MTSFPCTPGGAIARGKRRLRRLLGGFAALALAAGAAAGWAGRPGPAALALLAALFPVLALRMSGGLDPVALELAGSRLTVRLRRGAVQLELAGGVARLLSPAEVAHLERLATTAGLTAASGGFDSHLLGEFDLYASDPANAVLVEAGEARVIVTPDRPGEFLAACRECSSRASEGRQHERPHPDASLRSA